MWSNSVDFRGVSPVYTDQRTEFGSDLWAALQQELIVDDGNNISNEEKDWWLGL